MEGFEQVVKLAMECDGLVVSGSMKFRVPKRTRKTVVAETQSHGYEVDLVGANAQQLVLASVKSFFNSPGVTRQGFQREFPKRFARFILFNDVEIQSSVIRQAAKTFGYRDDQVKLRLYVGNFKKGDEEVIRQHLDRPPEGLQRADVFNVTDVVDRIMAHVEKGGRMYVDCPVIATLKALQAAERISGEPE